MVDIHIFIMYPTPWHLQDLPKQTKEMDDMKSPLETASALTIQWSLSPDTFSLCQGMDPSSGMQLFTELHPFCTICFISCMLINLSCLLDFTDVSSLIYFLVLETGTWTQPPHNTAFPVTIDRKMQIQMLSCPRILMFQGSFNTATSLKAWLLHSVCD